jgi:hypothetical protein
MCWRRNSEEHPQPDLAPHSLATDLKFIPKLHCISIDRILGDGLRYPDDSKSSQFIIRSPYR